MPSCLYIVSTPIGNLKDITLRAIQVLKEVNAIYCEDSRQTYKLCSQYDITSSLLTYHEHNAEIVRPKIIQRLQMGDDVALVSDAGTPLISDPGYKLVKECLDNGLKVQAIPGACSPIAALVSSGLPTDQFYFLGFMPNKSSERQKTLQAIYDCPATQIYFESANRLINTLEDIDKILADREIVICRELTKTFEEVRRGSARELITYYQQEGTLKGEIILLVKGSKQERQIDQVLDVVLKNLINQVPIKQATAWLAELTGVSKHLLYQRGLEIKEGKE